MKTGASSQLKSLDQLRFGDEYEIISLNGSGEIKKRLLDMGFIPGARGVRLRHALFYDPIEIQIGQYKVSLRQKEARNILVLPLGSPSLSTPDAPETFEFNDNAPKRRRRMGKSRFSKFFDPQEKSVRNFKERLGRREDHDESVIRVAVAGNPNTGKSTLFNALTGSHVHVGNYAGVTVETKKSRIAFRDFIIEFIDLPGIYSLSAYSFEEVVGRDFILLQKPEVVLDVIDATNLERNFYLCLQFQELGVPVIGALNMMDAAEKKGISIDTDLLGNLLHIPFVKTSALRKEGLDLLLERIIEVAVQNREIKKRAVASSRSQAALTEPRGRHCNYGHDIETAHENIIAELSRDPLFAEQFSLHWVAIKLLENDKDAYQKVEANHRFSRDVLQLVSRVRARLEKMYGMDSTTLVAQQRYGFIRGALREAVVSPEPDEANDFTEKVDRWLLHQKFGLLFFFGIMFLVYNITFLIGDFLAGFIDTFFGWLARHASTALGEGILKDFIVDGMIGGVGGVIVFLPVILLLFAFLSFLEDTGYMARAAFVMDKVMHKFGLHGRSFIPMMISTGCAVPAVLATRTLANHRDRVVTAIVLPMMMCSAKTPVVAMLMAGFFGPYSGLMFWLLWLSAWLVALISARLLSRVMFKGNTTPFVMELPPYRMPTASGIIRHMWDKAIGYLRKAATVILAASVITWILFHIPQKTGGTYDQEIVALTKQQLNAQSQKDISNKIKELEFARNQENIRYSYGGRLGVWMQPFFAPLGMDWKMVVALLAAMPAKEIVISTFGVLYGVEGEPDSGDGNLSIIRAMRHDQVYNPAIVFAFAIFLLLYIPCLATLAVIKKEFDGWRWVLFTQIFSFLTAYAIAWISYQIGLFFLA